MPLTPGTILGQYEIRSPLGAGGMGEVYRAHDTRLDREVAIKVLPESLTADPDRLRRFEQEARAVAALNHPNILAVYQMATHEGVSHMVSELLDGETLRERLRHGPIPLRKAIDYAVQIAHGLAAAHDKGIVHRDLKPDNLFVTKDGRVKILDFGLAKLVQPKDASGAEATLAGVEATVAQGTEPGMVMGTVGYMSPEQVRGKVADHRSDTFAFGTILYEMVTGKQTFRKPTSAETMSAILNEDPPSISQVTAATPPGLQRVVHRCLEKNPEQRFQSASDMAFALEALSDSGMAASSGSHAHLGEPASRRGIAMAGATLAVLLGVGALAYFWIRPAAVPKVSNYVQLTHDGQPKSLVGTEGSRLFLYVASGDNQGMAEMSTSGGEPRKMHLPPFSFNSPQPLSLSPDGSELLVMDGHGVPPSGPLWSVPVVGGSPRKLGDIAGQGGAWSADGKFIAYSNGNSLFTAKADGTDARKVVTVGDAGFIFNPVWSPDGTQLRFIYGAWTLAAPPYFMEVSLDGTGLHRLLPGTNLRPDSEDGNGGWTVDGKYFVFMTRGQIWALPRKAGFLHSEPKPSQLTSSPMPLSPPVQSTDGKKLFVVGRTFRGELTRYDLKSGRFESYLGGISAEYVSFSKDGQWVAYVSYPEGTLWRSKMDGSERLQLTYAPSQALMPRWSPDGKTILFFDASGTNKPSKIYEVSLEGGSPQPLMPDNPDPQLDPNWSPDGSKIVFAGGSADAASSIRVFDLATRQVSTLPGSQGMSSPRWSPDGRYIPALSIDSKKLLLFDLQTRQWTELAQGSMGWLEWSKDGQYLQADDGSGTGAVIRIRLSDHKTERVVDLKNFATVGYYGFWFAVAPDDSPIMLRNAGTQDVYALDWEEP